MSHTRPTLCIWQQNINKPDSAQHNMLSKVLTTACEVIAIQEPYLDRMRLMRSTAHWRVHYPTVWDPDTAGRVRSVILVSKQLSTNAWSPITVPHPDITAITITTPHASIHVFNLYVDGDLDAAINAASRASQRLCAQDGAHELVWLGGFNRHHPSWDSPRNSHLFTRQNLARSDVLIHRLAELGLEMVLPPELPTLEATHTKNLTRPDNVFCMEGVLEHLRSCEVFPELSPTCTDHFPIQTIISIPTEAAPPRPRRDFRKVDWVEFNAALGHRLNERVHADVITTTEDFDDLLQKLMTDLQDTVAEQVPLVKDTPYRKRWWSKDLSCMRGVKERLASASFRLRSDPQHTVHAEYRRYRNRYADAIRLAKKDFWEAWIDTIDSKSIWDANRFLKQGASDGGSARIPPINTVDQDGCPVLKSNTNKGEEFYKTFFLPPSTAPIPAGPYPPPRFKFRPVTDEQVRRAIHSLKAFKVPGPDAIPNEVYRHCAETLTLILGTLF